MILVCRQSLSSIRFTFCFAATLSLSLSVAVATPKKSKPRVPETAAAPSQPAATAQLRLWKFTDPSVTSGVQIRLLPGEGKRDAAATTLSSNSNHYEIGNFTEVPSGTVTLEITLLPGGAPSLLPVHLPPGTTRTVIVHVKPNGSQAKLADEEPAPNVDSRSFSVYNLLPGDKGDVQVTLGDVLSAHVLSAGGSLCVHGVKASSYSISSVGTDGEGKPFRWNGETDLRKIHHATLIICPDAYGRTRPRVIEDGGETTPSDKGANG